MSNVHVTVPAANVFFFIIREILFLFKFYLFIFLAALGLRYGALAFSNCSEQGLLPVVVCGLLIAVAPLVAEHGL